jgi:hypothetical protein
MVCAFHTLEFTVPGAGVSMIRGWARSHASLPSAASDIERRMSSPGRSAFRHSDRDG